MTERKRKRQGQLEVIGQAMTEPKKLTPEEKWRCWHCNASVSGTYTEFSAGAVPVTKCSRCGKDVTTKPKRITELVRAATEKLEAEVVQLKKENELFKRGHPKSDGAAMDGCWKIALEGEISQLKSGREALLDALGPFAIIKDHIPASPMPPDEFYLWSVSRTSSTRMVGINARHIFDAAKIVASMRGPDGEVSVDEAIKSEMPLEEFERRNNITETSHDDARDYMEP